jgi:hypothetical protein
VLELYRKRSGAMSFGEGEHCPPERFRYSDLKEAVWKPPAMYFGLGTVGPEYRGRGVSRGVRRESGARQAEFVGGLASLRVLRSVVEYTTGDRAGARRISEMRKDRTIGMAVFRLEGHGAALGRESVALADLFGTELIRWPPEIACNVLDGAAGRRA